MQESNSGSTEQQVVYFSFRSGPSNGRHVRKEEIEESREKTRKARERGIYLSPEQRAQIKRLKQKN